MTVLIATTLSLALLAGGDAHLWRELEPGLELARFDVRTRSAEAYGDLTVLRVDPRRRRLAVLTAAADGEDRPRTVRQWCKDLDLAAAVNAGMYQADGRTHVGFCQVDGQVLNGAVNDYLSVLVCDPVDPDAPPFGIRDLDVVPLDTLRVRYRTVVQNLRLIKGGRDNRWSPTRDRWREAALAEDAAGRALFIYCSRPVSMHDFNEALLALPLDVVAAQHLEGSEAAGLWIAGSGGTGSAVGGSAPNVLVVRRRAEGERP
ncbi:MAG: phosphodiester glycosidase family protein [bacterium]|nr:phosphodiester glycosidase family protein [bacterium]